MAGNQKISPPRKKPKISQHKKRRWGVSIDRQGSIIFRAVSARCAWKLWWRTFISSIAYILYVLMRAVTNLKTKGNRHDRRNRDDGRNRHQKVPLSALIHAPPRRQKKVIYDYPKYQETRYFPRPPRNKNQETKINRRRLLKKDKERKRKKKEGKRKKEKERGKVKERKQGERKEMKTRYEVGTKKRDGRTMKEKGKAGSKKGRNKERGAEGGN